MGLHFLSFWPCGPSFWPSEAAFLHIFAFWGCISSYLSFGGAGPWAPPPQLAKNPFKFAFLHNKFNGHGPRIIFCFFGLLGLHFLLFWPFGPSFPFILAFWAFMSFHFGFLGLHFLSFWSCGPSFPFILAFWAFISLHFGLVGLHFGLLRLHFFIFWPSEGAFLHI